jgi:hypothetical protein
MRAQNHDADQAFARWRPTGLRIHLEAIRHAYRAARPFAPGPRDISAREAGVTLVQRCTVTNFGHLTWGVFTRAFWPIYRPGITPRFYGSVVFSFGTQDEDSPSLFEVAQEIRTLRDDDEDPLEGVEDFARIIRDDYSAEARVPVPGILAMRNGCHLQSIGIERHKLPCGYLHHRLVPIITHPAIPYATLVHHRYWSPDFTTTWLSGHPLLSREELESYQADFPTITP